MRTLNRAYLVNFQSREIIWSRDWKWTNGSEFRWSKILLTDRLCAWLQIQEDNPAEDDDYQMSPKGRCRVRFRMLDLNSGREVVDRMFWHFDGGDIGNDSYPERSPFPMMVASKNLVCFSSTASVCFPDFKYLEVDGVEFFDGGLGHR